MNKRCSVLYSPFSPLKYVLMVVLSWFSFTYCNAQLITDENATNTDIANLISGTGLDITNFTIVSGQNSQIGTFTYPMDAVLGLDQGMIISTGDLNQLIGPNNTNGSTVDNSINYNDPDLLAIEANCNNDVVVIEFDVIPKCDTLVIDFQFASEEYPEYVCSSFNDAFAFLVSGPGIAGPYTDGAANFAILPDGTDVTINGVNDGGVGTGYPLADCSSLTNTAFYTDNTAGADLQFDGFTTPLQAKGVVVPCQTYHVKILLGDSGDGWFDSAVFLKSFSCPSQAVSLVPDPVFSDAIEGCQFGLFNLTRSGDTTVPLSVDFTLSGTAASSDYTFEDLFGNSVSSPLNYAADEVDKFLLIRPVSDALTEGNETVDLNLTWFQCSDSFTLTETINLIDNYVDIECQNDTTIYVNSGTCTKDFDFSFPIVDSNCSASLSRTDGSGLNSGDDFPLGTTTIGWRAEANSGLLSAECTFNVTVVDDEDPVANCQNVTIQLNDSGNATISETDLNNGSTDNCSISGFSASQTSFDCGDLGANSVTLTVTDGSGNTHSCVAIVTVEDNVPPVDITLPAVNEQCFVTLTPPTTTDNCGGTLTGTTSDPTTYTAQGNYSVTWTFDDGNGNTSTEIQAVNVVDTTAPNAICRNRSIVLDGSGNATITAAFIDDGSSDNCNIASISANILAFDCGDLGPNSVTLTVTDDAGNTNTCVATVTVEDNTNPTLTTQNVTIQLDTSGAASITPGDVTNTTADNCGTPTVTVDQTTFDCSQVGANTVNVTATDASGNAVTETATVTVEDSELPTANCQDITVGLDGSGNATITSSDIDGGSTDNCGAVTLSASQTAFTSADLGPNNVTLTVTDANGNTATCTAVVTVSDSNPPTAVCQDITVQLDATGNISITAADIDNGSTDNGVITSITVDQTAFECTHVGANTVTLTVTDDAGNTNTCVATVTVEDNIDPTLTTQNVTVQLDGSGAASITPADVTNTTADNCGTPTVTVDQTTFDCSQVGANTVNVTATDASGNAVTETATVTVEDSELPTANCQDITVGLDGSGNATITASDIDGGSTDNCGAVTLSASQTAFTSADLGPNNVTLTVTDANGNTATCTAVVTVSDSNPPTAVCQDITVQLDATGNVSITAADIDGGSTDNGTIVSITASQTAFDCSHVGANNVTLTVTDDAGNTNTCVATVTVEDNTNPTLTTQDVTIQLDGSGAASITPAAVTAVTADNCGTPTVTADQTTFDCSQVGANTVNVTATDASGNTVTETATVTVEDIEDPTAVCLDITVGLDGSGNATITASDIDGGSTDNCGAVTLSASQTAFTSADLGPNNVTLTVTDANGNTATCTAVVTVSDSNPPTAVCQDITVQLDATGNVSITAADIDGGSTDNGTIVSMVASQTDFDCSHVGANNVTLTVTDDAGNTNTCVATVTVEDNTNPTLTTQNVTVQLDGSGAASITAANVTNTTADNCGTPTVTVDQTTFDCSQVGANTVNVTATDASGNTVTETATVTVEDNELPTAVCLDITVGLDGSGNATITALDIDGGSTDNCAIASMTASVTAFTSADLGPNNVTLTVTDANGNTATCTAVVTVSDSNPPTAVCQDITVQLDATGNVSITAADIDGGSTDNGTIVSITASQTAFDCSHVGANNVTLTVTDDAGNTNTCVATVTVEDNTNPTLTTQDVTIQLDGSGAASITPAAVTAVTADNCGTPTVTADQTTFDCSQVGANTVNVTATDASGNTVTETATVTVEDIEDPTAVCLDITVGLDGSGNATITASDIDGGSTDNCGAVTLSASQTAFTSADLGPNNVTLTVTDANGNTATCTAVVTVSDSNPPTAVCQDITVQLDATGNVSITAADIDGGSTDNGTIVSMVASQTAFDCSHVGANNVTLTVTDDAGNTNTCVATVTVEDNTNPTLTTQNVTIQLDTSGAASITPGDVTNTTADNCGTPTVTVDQTTFDCSQVGANTVNVTATDASGNTVTETATVTVEDNELPTAVCLDITVGLDGSGNATITALDIDGGSTDNCAIASMTASVTAFTSADLGPNNVTLTVTDANGNTATCTAVVTVSDSNPPTAVCQDITVQLDATGNVSITAADIDGGSTDNGTIVSMVASQTAFDCSHVGANNVTLTVTDDAGNTNTCVAAVTVEDNIDPTLTTQNVTVQLDGSGAASITPADVTNTTADNCGTPTVTVDQTTFDCSQVGANTVNVTATDASGNAVTETATVTVEDSELPTANCQDITVGLDGSGNATITALDIDGGSTDNCAIASMTASVTAFTSADLGPNNVTLTVTDANGNTATCTAVVTVSDSNPPTAVCQDITVQLDATGNVSITAADIDGGSTDNGLITSIIASQTAFDCTDLGANSVTLTVTDDAGNTNTCVATVTVEDNINPTLTTQDVTIQLDASGAASIVAADVTNTTADNCGTPTVTVDQTTFNCSQVGANTVNVTATDASGNTVTETATVTVEDNELPTAVCLDITVGLDGSGNATITALDIDGGSTDNCAIASMTASVTAFTSADLGPNNVTLTVTDANGNTATCTAVVTVSDSNPPTAVCQDITVQLDATGNVSITAADIDGGSTDNGTIVSMVASQTAFDCSHVGANNVTLTVTDDAGNTNTCVATVTVEDNIDPTLTTQDAIIYLDDSGDAILQDSDVTNGVTDNCATQVITVSDHDFDCSLIGNNTVDVTMADGSGNTVTEPANVEVVDDIDPTAVCQDISLGLDLFGVVNLTPALVDGGSYDNCTIVNSTVTPDVFSILDLGTQLYTLTVEDQSGNLGQCTASLIISDSNPPNAVCQDITVELDATGNVSIQPEDLDGGSTDNGTIVSIDASQTDFTCSDLGSNSVTVLMTDDAGNSSSCVAMVTVVDLINPVIVPQDITVSLDGTGAVSITPQDVTASNSDNCADPTVTIDSSDFNCADIGTNTVNITATDQSGNTVNETAVVTVLDDTDPEAVCLDITVGLDEFGNASIVAADVDGGSSDNCSIVDYSIDVTDFTSADLGPNTVVLTVTDQSGNQDNCNATVTVSDSNPPNAVCQDITIELDVNGNAIITASDIDGGSTDNGVIVSITASQTDFDCTHVGENTVILTVTDDAGNTDSCVATVTVVDLINPVIVPQDITVSLDGTGAVSITPQDVTASNSDNCADPTVTIDSSDFNCADIGTNTVNITATDQSGNTVNETAVVTVLDDTDPEAVCLDITVGLDEFGNASIVAADVDGGSSDNCSIVDYSIDVTDFTSADLGPNTVVLTVTDQSGNQDNCNATVTVSDSNPPNAVCQDITIELDVNGNAIITASDIDGGSTDNGVIVSITASQTDFDCTHVGENTVILTVTDDAGNTDSCVATVTVVDTINPVVQAQGEIIYLDATGNASITPSDLVIVAADNCEPPTVTVSQTDFDCSDLGDNVVTLTVTDSSGNITTVESMVGVIDDINPTAVCQDISVSLTESGNVAITPEDVDGGSSDNCSIVDMSIDVSSFDTSNLGPNTVALTVTDQSGNTDQCQATVTIEDNIPPVAICQEVIISLDVNGNASVTAEDVDGGSTDNGGVATLTVNQTDFDCSHLGENTVTLTVEDFDGNIATCQAIVTVVDEINPQISECITSEFFTLDENCEFIMPSFLDQFEFFDNCSDYSTASVIQSPAAGEVFTGNQVINATITVTDSSGLSDVCEFTITLEDDIPPVIECSPNQEHFTDPGSCNAVLEFDPPVYSDACGIESIELTQGLPSGSSFPIGETFMEWTAVDMNGNIATCAYIITVSDEELPIIECYENQTIEADENCQAVVEDYLSGLVVTDNCTADLTLTQTPVPGTVFSGSTSITISAEDSSGNIQTCEFTIEVIDTTYPTLICPENIIQAEPVVNYELPVYSDNCSAEMTLVDGLDTGSEFPHGISEVFYQVEDSSGNITECSFMVLVNQAPLGDSDSSFVDSWIEDINIEVISNDEDPDNDEFYITDAWTASGNTDAIYNEDGTIDYVIYNEDYCGEDELVYIICDTYGACDTVYSPVVVECFNGIIIPEGFSPNNDGTNDFLEIKGIQHFPNNTVAIFNRWGHKLYSMEGYMNDWDGTTQSSLNLGQGFLPEATYFIVLDLGDGSPPLKSYLYLNR